MIENISPEVKYYRGCVRRTSDDPEVREELRDNDLAFLEFPSEYLEEKGFKWLGNFFGPGGFHDFVFVKAYEGQLVTLDVNDCYRQPLNLAEKALTFFTGVYIEKPFLIRDVRLTGVEHVVEQALEDLDINITR
jgi:hypothetical protein